MSIEMKNTPFICREDPSQVGEGKYILTAYFLNLGVCVKYEIESVGFETNLVMIIEKGTFTMSELIDKNGSFEDFSVRAGDREYNREPIIRIAYKFAAEKAAKS